MTPVVLNLIRRSRITAMIALTVVSLTLFFASPGTIRDVRAVACPSGGNWPYQCLANSQPLCSSVMPANAHLTGVGDAPGIGRCALSYDVTCNECGVNFNRNCNACQSYSGWACNSGFVQTGGLCCSIQQGQKGTSMPNPTCGVTVACTIQCDGSCLPAVAPNSACAPPVCNVSSTAVAVNEPILATGTDGTTPYSWTAPGGNATPQIPPTSAAIVYAVAGIYTASITDANGIVASCPAVTVCVTNQGDDCESPINACNQTEHGIVQCDGSCRNTAGNPVQIPPESGCPPPACSFTQNTALPLATVQANGIGGLKPYSWSGTGIQPSGTGDSFAHYYTATGTKTVTVAGKNGASSTCSVTILAPYQTTGVHTTTQNTPGHLDYSTDYSVRARVWDESGASSSWSALYFPASTVAGPWPTASFSWSPLQIFAGLPVQFQDASTPTPMKGWRWLFDDGTSTDEITGTSTPEYTFAAEGSYTVTLEATNDAGMCISLPVSLKSGKALPIYREVRPGSRPSPTPGTNR